MEPFYNKNGLMFWTEKEFLLREQFRNYFVSEMRAALLETNPAWRMMMVEAPILTPKEFINSNYTDDDMFITTDLVLRPETTPGTYQYVRSMFDSSTTRPPICVWQVGKSFRKEQDQVTKHMRLKEFYQLEFQCIFASDSAADYHSMLLEPVGRMIGEMVGLPTRLVESDRLPAYSLKTTDVESTLDSEQWMELASVSLRTDFPGTVKFNTKKGESEKELRVAEVAIGLDRCVYNFMQRTKIT